MRSVSSDFLVNRIVFMLSPTNGVWRQYFQHLYISRRYRSAQPWILDPHQLGLLHHLITEYTQSQSPNLSQRDNNTRLSSHHGKSQSARILMTFYADHLSLLAPGPRSGVELFLISHLSSSITKDIGGAIDLVTTQKQDGISKA